MSNIEQGLTIMVLGLSITFSALGIFIGIIMLLGRVFPAGQEPDSLTSAATDEPAVSRWDRDCTEEEIAAAITIALAHLHSYELCRSRLGEALEDGPGQWSGVGQVEALHLYPAALRPGQ